MSLKNLKRNKTPSISDLVQRADDADKSARPAKDDRFWTPTRDKAGNGYAVIRFLPAPDGDAPWERYWDHGFQGPTGQWYIEKSLTSIGKPDPVSELNVKLYNSGRDEDKKTVSQQKRKLHYVSNILVISDPAAPENDGKVFLFRYGKKIHDMILRSMKPEFPDETPVNPFDPWEGADFVMKIRMQDKFPNYDASSFKSPSELDEATLNYVDGALISLKEFIDPAGYKSYEELKARLDLVLGGSGTRPSEMSQMANEPERAAKAPAREKKASPMPTAEETGLSGGETVSDAEDDDIMAQLARLAEED